MATLITSIGASAFDSTGARRLAVRLEQKLNADYLAQAHKEDFAWGDMAVPCARTLAQRKLPIKNRLGSEDFDPTSNKIKVMTMKVSKGLEFPVVALLGVGHMLAPGEDEKEAARVLYVAATSGTQRLVIGIEGIGKLTGRLE